MHPTPQEKAIIDEAEKIMIENMARYDPSHDQYHGERDPADSVIEKYMDQPRMSERVSIQFNASEIQPWRLRKISRQPQIFWLLN